MEIRNEGELDSEALADLPARREPLDKLETLKRPLDRLRTYSLALPGGGGATGNATAYVAS